MRLPCIWYDYGLKLDLEQDALAVAAASRAVAAAATQRRETDTTGDKTDLVNNEASRDGHTAANASGPSGKRPVGKKVKKGAKPKLTAKEKKERAVRYMTVICFVLLGC